MMRLSTRVSARVCCLALATVFVQILILAPNPISAQAPPAVVELPVDPWQGTVEWWSQDGEVIATHDPAYGTATITNGGSVIYRPTPEGDFWTVGSDRWIVIVELSSDGSRVEQRLTARATSPRYGPPTTDFESAVDDPAYHGRQELLSIDETSALLGQRGAKIELDGVGDGAYFQFPVVPRPFRGTNNSDAGCADLRMGLGSPSGRQLTDCLMPESGREVCRFSVLSAVAAGGVRDLFEIEAGVSHSETVVRGVTYDESNMRHETEWVPLADRPHDLRLDWWTGDKGGLRLRVDGRVRGELRDIDTGNFEVHEMRVGAPAVPAGARFAVKLDAITVRNGEGDHDTNEIITDSFEEDLTEWDALSTAGGDLSVEASAALGGKAGLYIGIGSGWGAWVLDKRPLAEPEAGVRFRLNADHLTLGELETLPLVLGQPDNGAGVQARFQINLWQNEHGVMKIRASADDDAGERQVTPYVDLPDGGNRVELTWRAATEGGSDDGRLRLWLNGQLVGELAELDNDTVRIESVRFGAMYLKPETSGILHLDEFESWR